MHTYLSGHTYATTIDKTVHRMESLARWGRMNWYSSLTLGYLLHYLEDYFTFPHNVGFSGTLAEHVRYERTLTDYLKNGNIAIREKGKEHVSADIRIENNREFTIDTAELVKRVKEQHECYEQAASDFKNDMSNIMEVAYYVTYSYRMIFRKNQKQTDRMPFLELTTDDVS